MQIKRDMEKKPAAVKLDAEYLRKAAERLPDIGRKFEYLLNTGNLASRSGLDLSQVHIHCCLSGCRSCKLLGFCTTR